MGAMIEGRENVLAFRDMLMVRALAIEVQTGMKAHRGVNALSMCREAGFTDKRTKKAALIQIIDNMREQGMVIPASLEIAYATAKK